MRKKQLLKWILPVCVLLIVAGIWLVKNMPSSAEPETTNGNSETAGVTGTENPDFALQADEIDLETLTSYGLPIIIDFGADWCSPCRSFEPILEKAHDDYLNKAVIKYVDVDDHSDIASRFPVSVIPTQVFFLPDGSPYVPGEGIDVEFTAYSDSETGEHRFTVHEGSLSADQLAAILADMGVTE